MYAFLGILICASANNSNTDHVSKMWKSSSYPLYRATIGNRFKSILHFIRFDEFNMRQQCLREDKIAPIRDLWNKLNANLCTIYRPMENLTIDKQLFSFRGRTNSLNIHRSQPNME